MLENLQKIVTPKFPIVRHLNLYSFLKFMNYLDKTWVPPRLSFEEVRMCVRTHIHTHTGTRTRTQTHYLKMFYVKLKDVLLIYFPTFLDWISASS